MQPGKLSLLKTITVLILIFFCSVLQAQEKTNKEWNFKKEVEFWSKWQRTTFDAPIDLPGFIKEFRQSSTSLPITFDSITDNPLMHGATYLRLKTQSTYKHKVRLYADLFAEHRGVSYGLYNQDNTTLYPILRLEARDTLTIFNRQIELSGIVGQFLDETLDAGLMIYNLDAQGFQLNAFYKGFNFRYTLYGDLNRGIGLNIDDLKSYSVQKKLADSGTSIGVSYVSARPPHYPLKNYFNLNVFATKQFKNVNLYAQAGIRPYDYQNIFSKISLIKHSAFLFGAQGNTFAKKWEYKWKAELRYYGFLFNYEYYDIGLRYRKPATDIYSMYANTIGSFLYPLRKFDSPFSQWGVFNEYVGFNTGMLSLTGNFVYHLSPKFDVCLHHDINYIKAQLDPSSTPATLKSNFLYPFYDIGVGYKPANNIIAKASITNKAMNLDISYPTHYLFKNPQVQLSLSAYFY